MTFLVSFCIQKDVGEVRTNAVRDVLLPIADVGDHLKTANLGNKYHSLRCRALRFLQSDVRRRIFGQVVVKVSFDGPVVLPKLSLGIRTRSGTVTQHPLGEVALPPLNSGVTVRAVRRVDLLDVFRHQPPSITMAIHQTPPASNTFLLTRRFDTPYARIGQLSPPIPSVPRSLADQETMVRSPIPQDQGQQLPTQTPDIRGELGPDE